MASIQSLRADRVTAPPPPLRSAAQTADGDEIVLFQADRSRSIRFRTETQLLRVVLADLEPSIECIGSTAVTELAAKPIIDIGWTCPPCSDSLSAPGD